ncbi:MAG: class I SAM-dependent methyltransferase [Deltaproteobacteria bacterium]|nr:class I SAM-dependent methyltransferase [Deltaproteobacteria bacterium]
MQLTLAPPATQIRSERELLGVALGLGAQRIRGWSADEEALVSAIPVAAPALISHVRAQIETGEDPLGVAFCSLRSPVERRPEGATYTPLSIVKPMLAWAKRAGRPDRVVDPGAGSGRFLVNAGRCFPAARLVAVEVDPLAAVLARAHLAAAGLGSRSQVLVADYRCADLRDFVGSTLFIGNPPYVRHHLVGQRWKDWLTKVAAARGLPASQLSGLHVYFFLATLEHANPGDYGVYVTAAEWLDVNYGALVRKLFVGGLGGTALHLIEPTAVAFPDAITTAAITCFHVGAQPKSVRVRRVAALTELGALDAGRSIRRERLATADRWTPLTRGARAIPDGCVELGEVCRVRRGQVTGANAFWIAGDHSGDLPQGVLFPTVTRARELYRAGRCLVDASRLHCVIDLPEDLDALEQEDRHKIEILLRKARAAGVHRGYIARHRKAWWSVGLHEPAPILATYMARRPPGFVRNLSDARHINIAHGIYPREPMSDRALAALADYLAAHTSVADGRTYAGGLTKFEPREMERLLVPSPEFLV